MNKIEKLLMKGLAYKFETQAEIRETYSNLFEKVLDGLGYLARPIAQPIDRLMEKIYNWYEKS